MLKCGGFFSQIMLKAKARIGRVVQEMGGDLERLGSNLTEDVAYKQVFSRHRQITAIDEIYKPSVAGNSFVSDNASLVGDVDIKDYSCIGFNSVLRAETSPIR